MGEDRERARAGRDVAGVGPDPREVRHLMPLGELRNVHVSSGEPDIRGWRVYSSAGRDLGKVDDLLIDTTRGEVAMLDIGLAESDRHTLAPIRAAWVDREHKRVILDGAQFDAGEEIPSLSRGRVSDDEANWRVVDHEPAQSAAQSATSEETGERASAAESEPREVRYPTREEGAPRVVEEVVVRRRILDENESAQEPPAS